MNTTDALAVLEVAMQNLVLANFTEREVAPLREARTHFAALAERGERLVEAAGEYFDGYCMDEAEDNFDKTRFGYNTGCTKEQHEAAIRLRAAIAAYQGEQK